MQQSDTPARPPGSGSESPRASHPVTGTALAHDLSEPPGPHADLPAAESARDVRPWTYRVRGWEYLMRSWRPYFVAGITEAVGGPVLYLLVMGLGLGSLVNRNGTGALGGISYIQYIAPALLCTAALQIAFSECAFALFGRIKWRRTLWAMTATPITPAAAADAHVMFVSTRLLLSAILYYLVLLVFGVGGGALGLLMIPIAVLTAMSAGVWIMVLATTLQDDAATAFNLVLRFGVIPASLFSASFFPIEQLHISVRWLAFISPLWHGNELARDAIVGGLPGWRIALHLGVLLALLGWGFVTVRRQFGKRLAA